MSDDMLPGRESAPTRPGPRTRPPKLSTRHRRELVFGIALAILVGIALTWWATSSPDPKPTFLPSTPSPSATSGSTFVSGAPAPSVSAPSVPSPPAVLATTYRLMHAAFVQSHSYKTISLAGIARAEPGVSIEDGTVSSTNASVVSMLAPAPDRVVLAVRDDTGCSWLRDYGPGPQVAEDHQLVITCSASSAPTTSWTAL